MVRHILFSLLLVVAIVGCSDEEIDRYYRDTLIQDLPGKTHVPDDAFEKYLIEYGYDNEIDNYVLTENIKNRVGTRALMARPRTPPLPCWPSSLGTLPATPPSLFSLLEYD